MRRLTRTILWTHASLGLALTVASPGCGGDGGGDSSTSESGDGDGDGSDGGSGDTMPGDSTSGGGGGTSGGSDGSGGGGTTGDPDGMETEGSFVQAPDGGGANIMCDVLAQDCPEGQKCNPASLDGDGIPEATRCVDIAGNAGAPGDDCNWTGQLFSGVDDCDIGTMCFPARLEDAVPDGPGFCINLCSGSADAPMCASPDEVCEMANDGALPWCLELCDPLANECRDGNNCFPIADGRFLCKLIGQPGEYADECGISNSCNKGLLCASAEVVPGCTSASCCTEVCSLSDPAGDGQCSGQDGGQVCTPAYADAAQTPPGYEDLGFCLVPQ